MLNTLWLPLIAVLCVRLARRETPTQVYKAFKVYLWVCCVLSGICELLQSTILSPVPWPPMAGQNFLPMLLMYSSQTAAIVAASIFLFLAPLPIGLAQWCGTIAVLLFVSPLHINAGFMILSSVTLVWLKFGSLITRFMRTNVGRRKAPQVLGCGCHHQAHDGESATSTLTVSSQNSQEGTEGPAGINLPNPDTINQTG